MSVLPQIPGYKLIRKLGHGGMADVFLGVQETLQREVAIKILVPNLFRDEQFALRFVKEARTAAQMAHPNIITVHDIGRVQDTYFIVMEYLQESLHDRIKSQGGTLSPGEALSIVRMVSAALDYAHRKGFIHRDIKPDNIMFRSDGTAVLVDFGIARAVDSTTQLTQTGMSIGTPHYMSPEQCRGEKIDGRSDIYSLGVQLYELLTGGVPYRAENTAGIILKHIQEPIPQLPVHLAAYQTLINRTMAKDRATRVQSAGELIQLIDVFITGQQPVVTVVIPGSGAVPGPRYTTPTNGVAWAQPNAPTASAVPTYPSMPSTPAYSQSAATPPAAPAPQASAKPKWPLIALAVSVILVFVTIMAVLNSGGGGTTDVDDNSAINSDTSGNTTPATLRDASDPLDKLKITGKSTANTQNPTAAPDNKSEPEQKPAPVNPQIPSSSSGGLTGKTDGQPGKTESPSVITPKNDTPGKTTDKTDSFQKPDIKPEPEKPAITPQNNVRTVTLLGIDPELRKEYNKQMEHITFLLPVRLPISAIAQVKGQVILQLGISSRGKIEITDADSEGLSVNPPRAKIRFMEILREKMNKTFVTPPTDKDGKTVRLSNWRVTFKVGKFNDKIILTKQ